MQFYLNGYRPGDPRVDDAGPAVPAGLPDEVDVLIVGAGPAGLVLAAQLAAFPDIRTAVIDRRDEPLAVGQADGVACRTVEMFEAFGLANRLLEEAYWVNEVAFWRPGDDGGIARAGRVRDTEEGLSEFPHVIVNQARMLAYLREHVAHAGAAAPFYGVEATALERGGSGVTVTTERGDTIRARYVVGCDGARSVIRGAIGRELTGDATDEAWGVMDVLAVTDFPDVRVKCAINSAAGNILIIPREGGYLTRFYIELDTTALDRRSVTPEKLAEAANRILHPYTLAVKDVGWWSVYEIGQRLCDRFDDGADLPRVFIAGDACHTHSAKAGQGMNVSMADAWNLGWKLAAVLRGRARPELLRTYSDERQAVAQELIDFDREFSKRFSRAADPEEFERYFVAQGRFTAGVATRYAPSLVTAAPEFQHLADGFPVGMRFHSAPVVRLPDAKPVQLGHAARADGAWRVYAFAGRDGSGAPWEHLEALVARFTPADAEPDSVIDVRAVFQQAVAVDALPAVVLPRKGRFGLVDYEKAFRPDPAAGDVFDLRRVDHEAGCLVVVRPDQYVAHVLPLAAHEALGAFLAGVLLEAR